jgi:hypothetical protein
MNKMRPVESGEVHDLLDWKPLLLLNKTLFGPAFVDSIVSRSPTLIKSKGGKELPLELWISILAFAVAENSEPQDYALVRPFILETREDGGKDLICQRFKRWTAFGTIQTSSEVEDYHVFLAHPDRNLGSYHNPFRNRDYGNPIRIPTELLDSTIDFLHVRLTVPDVIKYLEGSSCQLCWSERTIGGNGVGCRVAHRFLGGWEVRFWDALSDLPMLCPLCVGLEHAIECLQRRVPLEQGYATYREEYTLWLETKLQGLGFGKISNPRPPRPSGLRPSGGYLSSD